MSFLFQLVSGFSFLLSVAFYAVVRVAFAHLADVYACGTDFTFFLSHATEEIVHLVGIWFWED